MEVSTKGTDLPPFLQRIQDHNDHYNEMSIRSITFRQVFVNRLIRWLHRVSK